MDMSCSLRSKTISMVYERNGAPPLPLCAITNYFAMLSALFECSFLFNLRRRTKSVTGYFHSLKTHCDDITTGSSSNSSSSSSDAASALLNAGVYSSSSSSAIQPLCLPLFFVLFYWTRCLPCSAAFSFSVLKIPEFANHSV